MRSLRSRRLSNSGASSTLLAVAVALAAVATVPHASAHTHQPPHLQYTGSSTEYCGWVHGFNIPSPSYNSRAIVSPDDVFACCQYLVSVDLGFANFNYGNGECEAIYRPDRTLENGGYDILVKYHTNGTLH